MIYLDATRTGAARHRSGLLRVTRRLGEELGAAARAVDWKQAAPLAGAGDWFLTAEVFSEEERPGFRRWMEERRCRFAAIFHDAIPMRLPHVTWPRSVARHPAYLKLLAGFDRIWAVSEASRDELAGIWRWQGVAGPAVGVLALGADFDGKGRGADSAVPAPSGERGRDARGPLSRAPEESRPPALLCVGILEPRKNQDLLLAVASDLWDGGLSFELHIAGRVNPHFGRPIEDRILALARRHPGLLYHRCAEDADLASLYAAARACVLPTLAEGCGLPLLESLWRGTPCVCSDLPALRENAAGGGCLTAAAGDPLAWNSALRSILTDDVLHARLRTEARSRPLPTWAEAAAAVREALAG